MEIETFVLKQKGGTWKWFFLFGGFMIVLANYRLIAYEIFQSRQSVPQINFSVSSSLLAAFIINEVSS